MNFRIIVSVFSSSVIKNKALIEMLEKHHKYLAALEFIENKRPGTITHFNSPL